MSPSPPFTWRHCTAEMIRCSLREALHDRAVEERMRQRGGAVDPPTIVRWMQPDAPELAQHGRLYRNAIPDSCPVDETYSKVKNRGTTATGRSTRPAPPGMCRTAPRVMLRPQHARRPPRA